MKLSENFFDWEFWCPCPSCAKGVPEAVRVEPDAFMVVRLQMVRNDLGESVTINSGVRCYAHNVAVGGSVNSSHLGGYAVDIKCTDDDHRWRLLMALVTNGFKRIGIRKDFVHADVDPDKNKKRLWAY